MSLELFEDEKNGIYQKIDNISRDLGTLSNKIVKRHEFDQSMLRFNETVDLQSFKQALSSKADLETVLRLMENKVDVEIFESHVISKSITDQLAKLEKLIDKKADLDLVEKLAEHLLQKADEERVDKIIKELSKKCDVQQVENLEEQLESVRSLTEKFIQELDDTLGDFKAMSEQLKEDIYEISQKIGSKAELADIQNLRTALQGKLDSQIYAQEISKITSTLSTDIN